MSDLRTVTVNVSNDTDEVITINNAIVTRGKVITTEFPIPVKSGVQGSVVFEAEDSRLGAIGKVNYTVANIKGCSVNFDNSPRERNARFKVRGGPSATLTDNGHTEFTWEHKLWEIDTKMTDLDYVIVIEVSDVQ